ncbi:MAG: glycoside hydrolase family 28 protein [Bacteroides sp.]|nr:glycoside hydrolase family 28 protein [Bacteroides sp.]
MYRYLTLILASLFSLVTSAETPALPDFVEEIISMEAPVFPARTLSITKTGARHGHLSTAAIQKAIDRISAQGGGSVIIPKGEWLTGRIELKSNVNLHLDDGASLIFSGEIADYLPAVASRYEGTDVTSLGAMIYANDAENIAVTGNGHLIGPAYDCEIMSHLNAETGGTKIYPPTFIGPVGCRGILIENVTLDGSIFWNIAPVYCDGIIIRNVTVNSYGHPRTDGIDLDSSCNALVENVSLDCGDDCFTLKSGRGEDAVKLGRPTENIVIRNCHVKRGVGGLTIGTETAGFIRNVYAENIKMDNPRYPFYFKTRRPRGGGAEKIWIRNVTVNTSKGPAIQVDMLGSKAWVGPLAERYPAQSISWMTPRFSDIHIDNIQISSCPLLIQAKGIPEMPVENFTLTNVKSTNRNISLQDIGSIEITFAED